MIVAKFLRMEKGLSQREASKRAGIDTSTLSLIESGRLRPYAGQLKKLAQLLDVPEDKMDVLLDDVAFDLEAQIKAREEQAVEEVLAYADSRYGGMLKRLAE